MKFCRISLFLFLNIFSAVCATIFFLPKSWAVNNPDTNDIGSIVILPHYSFLIIVSVLASAALLALAITSLKVKDVPFRLALWLLPLVLFPASLARATFANLAPWETMGSTKDNVGNEYYFLESAFLQGDTMALARQRSHSFFKDEYEVLATTNGDSPRHFLLIVRPAKEPNGYGQILISNNTWLVGLRYDNQMYLAYNLNSRTAFARARIYTLSPFLLIDDHTEMNKTDVEQVLNTGIGSETGQARLKPILNELRNTNPVVASAANKMVERTTTRVPDE